MPYLYYIICTIQLMQCIIHIYNKYNKEKDDYNKKISDKKTPYLKCSYRKAATASIKVLLDSLDHG